MDLDPKLRNAAVVAVLVVAAALLYYGMLFSGPLTPWGLKLSVRHSVSGASHTYTGQLEVPACMRLTGGIKGMGSEPAHLTLVLDFIPAESGCTESSPSLQTFSASHVNTFEEWPVLEGVLINGTLFHPQIEEV